MLHRKGCFVSLFTNINVKCPRHSLLILLISFKSWKEAARPLLIPWSANVPLTASTSFTLAKHVEFRWGLIVLVSTWKSIHSSAFFFPLLNKCSITQTARLSSYLVLFEQSGDTAPPGTKSLNSLYEGRLSSGEHRPLWLSWASSCLEKKNTKGHNVRFLNKRKPVEHNIPVTQTLMTPNGPVLMLIFSVNQ